MKKRVLSWLLTVVMVLGMLPATALAADAVTEISTATELAALGGKNLSGKSYRLTDDIDMTGVSMTPITKLSNGTFDGNGHTISNLTLSVSSHIGLFAELSSYVTITGLTLKDCTITNTSGSYAGIGALVGKISGSSCVINECGVSGGTVSTKSTSAVYMGGLVGYAQNPVSISDCYSTAVVTSNTYSSSRAAGLVGYASSGTSIENCYVLGSVNANAGYSGGLIAYGVGTSTSHTSIKNCYSGASVTGTNSSYSYPFVCASNFSYVDFENCYYDKDVSNVKNANTQANITQVTTAELKSLSTLGDGFRADLADPINGGYPILSWQYFDPDAVYTVSFTVEPKNSVLTWKGEEQAVSANGKYEFADVKVGNYNYSVSNADDYVTAEGTVTVKNKAVAVPVTLELNKHTLTFDLTPDYAELTVKSGDDTLTPTSGRTYTVTKGEYTYSASAFGYQSIENAKVTVPAGDHTETVNLTAQPTDTVLFTGIAADANGVSLTVTTTVDGAVKTMSPEVGTYIYKLPAGYVYDWTFKCANYAKQTGKLDLTGLTEEKTESVTISMTEKTAWEGADDITEPSQVDGVYQITSGSELAWLAKQVNDSRTNSKSSYNAVLCNDIDLGNENWTPIGVKSGYYSIYPYKGQFDGQGHSVINLKTDNSSQYQGLFGYVDSGTIKNLTVNGTVKGGESTAGIVGYAYNVSIENCANKANVKGANNAAGIAGYATNGTTVKACANTGSISGSYNVGGIVGQLNGTGTVDHCYNTGDITATGGKAGGIVGYLYASSSSYKNTVSACYSTGKVSGTSSAAVVGNVYSTSYSTLEKLFFLEGESRTDSNATSKTSDELKALAATLGEPFLTAPADVNDGYPVFEWQIPTYAVTFTVDPAEAEVAIEGRTGTHDSNVWTFTLPDGTYDYTVTAFGYETKSGTITVSGGAVSETVALTAMEKRTVTFTISPANANAAVTVLWNGQTISPESDGTYRLPDGNYTYTVKAKGYAKVTDSLTVSKDETVPVTLTLSTAWDGTTKTRPTGAGSQASPYEIEDGEQLAWLADTVNNASTVSTVYAVLTDDIDLGGSVFTPIGKDFHEFTGSFDGQGHTVTGLNVSDVADAGLFGVAKAAAIKNVIVQGSVSGTSNAAGILARAKTTACTIENCGNEATVTSTGYAAGILANSTTNSTISACYNVGSITSTGSGSNGRAGGILGNVNSSSPVSDCYNTGNIAASSGYAGGIRGLLGSTIGQITRCYNAGTVTGNSTGAIAPGGSNALENCFYLNTGSDASSGAESLTLSEMQSGLLGKLGETNWKSVRGVNRNLPLLQWQTVSASIQNVTLVPAAFSRVAFTTEDGEASSLPTGLLKWKAVSGAQSYTVSLWEAVKTWVPLSAEEKAAYDAAQTAEEKLWMIDDAKIVEHLTDEQLARLTQLNDAITEANDALDASGAADATTTVQLRKALSEAYENRAVFLIGLATDADLGYYDLVLEWRRDIPGITATEYDFSSDFAALDEGIYYASVAVEENGELTCAPLQQVESAVTTVQNPYNRMKAVTNVRWDGSAAKWDGRANFTGTYQIDLYTVEGSDYTLFKTFTVPGQYTSANFANVFAAEKKYAFTVTALADTTIDQELGLTDAIPSDYSGVYDPSAGTGETKTWYDISSAEDWIKLANVKDEPSDSSDSSSPSNQEIEWSKNYRLTKDIDFSTLSAADQTKTKSIGTVTYPFMGEFDGQGHKITGLTLSNSDSGLFWYTGATAYVHNLTIDSANVLFSDNAAVLVHNNYGRIEKCAVVNTNITADTGAVLGGMVSRNYGVIRDSYVQGGTLTSNTTTSVGHAGFVGANEEGGLIERCWTSMNISTQSAHAGGFVGLGYGGTIRNCFALGNVSARTHSGGFVGRSVYLGNIYENCYAAGVVTVTEEEGNGFIGGNQSWSSFQYDQSAGITNCYYNSATNSSHDYGATGKSLDEMKAADFLTAISGSESGIWAQDSDHNNGLPYLNGVKAPETATTTQITVQIAIATYNKDTYSFEKSGDTISVTMDSNGNTRLVDLMDAAQAQKLLTYSYSTTSTFGRFIHTINGKAVDAPDGWMFTINDALSNVSASLATVTDGDQVLWFEGTTENHFQGPTWASLSGESIQWKTISTVDELLALANATDEETLGKNYKLAKGLDLTGVTFPGIGTAEHPFTGRFDGQNNTISNVTISGTDNVGFFGVIKGATIQNLNLENVNISGKEKVGGLVGYAQVALNPNDLSQNTANLIGSCTVSGTVSGEKQTGGLVGLNEGKTDADTLFSIASSIDKCSAGVTVTGKDMTGGLVGENSGTVTKSTAKGAVSGNNSTGGFVGDNTGDIYVSHAEGAVTGSNHTGGFAGSSTGTVKNCYSLGAVSGTDYTGSFAGSLAAADTVIGAGQVTVTGTPTQGYNGGLAGTLSGTVSGLDNRITVKNAFGNCTQPDGKNLNIIGNASDYQSDSQKAKLEDMTLSTRQEVGDKLYELFDVNLPDLENEAAKYVDSLTVPASTEAGSALDLLKPGAAPTPGVTVTYEVTDAHLTGGDTLTLTKGNDTVATVSVEVTLTLKDASGTYHKTVTVILPVTPEKRADLMDAIAKGYTETKDEWTAMDMAAYGTIPGKTTALTDTAKQNLLNKLISEANSDNSSLSDRSRIEIVLRSLGIDSTLLYSVNSSTPTDNAKILSAADYSNTASYTAPYILLADLQGNVKLSTAQVNTLIGVLKANMGSGLFDYERGGTTYTSPDTAGIALAALAKYYSTNADAKLVVDTVLAALPSAMDANGSFGNANADAMVIMGLIALGKDPASLTSASGANLVDGMLSYVNTETNQFQFYGKDNEMATEQAFRALVALAKFDGQSPYNVHDFHTTAVTPGRATGEGETTAPVDPPEGSEDIIVTVTITADNGTVWLPAKSVTVKEGSTVYHAFVKALEGTGITQDGAANGYVRSITKDGRTLAEFTLGKNSGWLYKVNGSLPSIPLTQQNIQNGDAIEFYYTADWTADPDAGSMGTAESDRKAASAVSDLIDQIGTVTKDSGDKITAARDAYEKLTEQQKNLVTNYGTLTAAEEAYARITGKFPFTDVKESDWFYEAVRFVYENDLFNGTSATTFSPNANMTRAMLVTVLYRLAGKPAVTAGASFTDVKSGLWYSDAVAWASANGIVEGMGSGKFAPDDFVTREQMAVILMRYTRYQKADTSASADLSRFTDASSVSPWAQSAMAWAVASGLVNGRTATTLVPGGTATRAEVAAILMRYCKK